MIVRLIKITFLRATDARVKRIVNENIAIDAVNFLAFWALEERLVGFEERTLTREAVICLFFVWHFEEGLDGKEMMIGAGKMRSKNQRETTNDTLNRKFTILCLALRAKVTVR